MDNENKVILNIGGQRFETNKTTLKKIPATRLSRLTEALANYDKILNEYFFDRHPGVFSQILNYYRTGKLHYPTNVCGPLFEAELEFWGLDSNQVEPCCWKTYTKHIDTQDTLATLERLCLDEEKSSNEELARLFNLDEDPNWQRKGLPWRKRIKPIIWQMFYEPNSSRAAKLLTYLSIFFIILSILTFCLSTVNDLCQSSFFCRSYNIRVTMSEENAFSRVSGGGVKGGGVLNLSMNGRQRSPTVLDYIEYVCITWFTFEFVIKFLVSPNKIKFFKDIINWIDLLNCAWFYGDLIYSYFLFTTNFEVHPAWDLLGTIRIMRLFKLFNYYPGLKMIVASLKASAGILRLLVFFIGVAVIIFASLIYYSEKLGAGSDGRNGMSSIVGSGHYYTSPQTNENQFTSIVEAIWFSIVSLTTVGFGDLTPKTPFGMIFGGMCTVASVLMIDLPMPIIVENFANYYNHLQARSKFPKKLRRKVLDVQAPRSRAHPHHSFHPPSVPGAPNVSINSGHNVASNTIALMTSKFGANVALIKSEPNLNTSVVPRVPKRFVDN